MSIIITIIELILVLSVVAIVHEFGHFIVAKAFKMTVNEFSIGFGKAIWQKKYKGTTYSFRLILLGGYVDIEGEDGSKESENAFCNKPCWQRILVLVAGVTFNFILGICIMLGINFASDTYTTTLRNLPQNSVLYEAGLRDGDSITSIGGVRTHIYQDIALYDDTSKNEVEVKFLSGGEEKTATLKNIVSVKGYIGVYFDSNNVNEDGTLKAIVNTVEPGSRAEQAGIKSGDEIISVENVSVNNSADVISAVTNYVDKEISITVLRNGNTKELKITPAKTEFVNLGIAGVEIVPTTLGYSWYKSVNTVIRVVNSYVDLFKGKVKLSQMSGIVGVGEMVSKARGVLELLSLVATISLAIGMANIMPFPPLDGGKVVLVLVEGITRKKFPQKVELVLSGIGFALLILLTIFVTIKDIIRII